MIGFLLPWLIKPVQLTLWDERALCRLCIEYRGKAAPPHAASPRCESGQDPHCTCDTCF